MFRADTKRKDKDKKQLMAIYNACMAHTDKT